MAVPEHDQGDPCDCYGSRFQPKPHGDEPFQVEDADDRGAMNTVGHWNRARHDGASRLVLNSSREGSLSSGLNQFAGTIESSHT